MPIDFAIQEIENRNIIITTVLLISNYSVDANIYSKHQVKEYS